MDFLDTLILSGALEDKGTPMSTFIEEEIQNQLKYFLEEEQPISITRFIEEDVSSFAEIMQDEITTEFLQIMQDEITTEFSQIIVEDEISTMKEYLEYEEDNITQELLIGLLSPARSGIRITTQHINQLQVRTTAQSLGQRLQIRTELITGTLDDLQFTPNLWLILNPEEGGEALVQYYYDEGRSASVIATPNVGWNFLHWSDIDGINYSNPYAFCIPYLEYYLTANFEAILERLLTLTVSPVNSGIVAGGGEYYPESIVPITATPEAGYRFERWEQAGITISTVANFDFEMPESETTLDAFFAENILTLELNSVVFFEDDFETGQIESHWIYINNATIVSSEAYTGQYSVGNTNIAEYDNVTIVGTAELYGATRIDFFAKYTYGSGGNFSVAIQNAATSVYYEGFDAEESANNWTQHTIQNSDLPIGNYYIIIEHNVGVGTEHYFVIDDIKITDGKGTITGAGNYSPDTIANINAIPGEDYTFVNWSQGATLLTTSTTYEYAMPKHNVTLTATFATI